MTGPELTGPGVTGPALRQIFNSTFCDQCPQCLICCQTESAPTEDNSLLESLAQRYAID